MALRFLDHGGEMGRRIREHDWEHTPFGPIPQWSAALRGALGICLGSSMPTAIYWGPELRLLYNDSWSFIPAERHPDCLGRPAAEVWHDIWDVIAPQFEQVLRTGDGFSTYNQLLRMIRDGRPVDSWWNYSFTPIRDETGEIVGIFNQGNETTALVLAERERSAEIERLQVLFAQAPGAVAILNGPEHRFELANPAYLELVGGRDLIGRTVAEALPEVAAQGFVDLLDTVRRTGQPYRGDNVAIEIARHPGEPPERLILNFVYQPIRDGAGEVIGIFVQAQDVTDRARAEAALSKAEARLRLALESSSGLGTWDWDIDTGIATADRRFAEIYGVDAEKALAGAPAGEFFRNIHPDDYPALDTATRVTIRDGKPYAQDYRVVAADGSVRWVTARGSCARDPVTGHLRFAGVSFDITERKAAEEAALASAAELRSVTERQSFLYQLAQGVRRLDQADLIMASVTEALGNALNLDRTGFFRRGAKSGELDFIACWTNGRLPPLNGTMPVGNMSDRARTVYERGETYIVRDADAEARRLGTDVARFSRAGIAVPLLRGGGWAASLYVSQAEARDWTDDEVALIEAVAEMAWDGVERAEAVMALRESEEKFRAITNSIDQMVWSTRPDGYHDFYNDRWYEFTGAPAGSTDGTAWNEMFHPDDRERAWARWHQSLTTGEPYHIEYRLRHVSGRYRWVLGRALPVRDADGAITRWFGTCTDIQEIVDAREVLARSREELEQLVTERTDRLMAAEEQLRQAQKMEAVGQLTGGIAHDFNNMLAVVIGGLDLLERRLAAGETDVGRYVHSAREGAERAAALTRRLLAFARRQPLAPRPVSASQLIAGMTELLARTLGEGIRVETDFAPGIWCATVDPGQLENAIVNLCVNARDAMPEGGTLTLSAGNRTIAPEDAGRWDVAPGDYVAISIRDTGTGMTPDVLQKAFEPFFTTKPVGKGTGLGLSQVFGFVRQSGGGLHIDSVPGEGTEVTLILPRDACAVPEVADHPSADAAVPRARAGEQVMLVEDDPRVRAFMAEALRDLGYSVLAPETAQEAFDRLDGGARPHLLLSDVVMPGMSGRKLAEAAHRRLPGLPVLFASGYDAERAADPADQLPGKLLIKPFTVVELAMQVRRAIDDGGA